MSSMLHISKKQHSSQEVRFQNNISPKNEKGKSVPIPIQKTKKMNNEENSYELTNQMFDPTQFSPPNVFMKKLKMRMNIYDEEFKNVLIREIA